MIVMKGFVRILEAIIASMILLSSLSYFFTVSALTDWDTALLQADVEDTLISMDKTVLSEYIKSNDKTAVYNTLRTLLPDTVDFSVDIVGIPNAEIFIGCNCSEQEISDLKQKILKLNPDDIVYFKDRSITIKVKNESINNIDPRTNILFLFDYEDLTPNRPFIDPFLSRGGTIFMFGRINPNPVDINLREIFGLEEVLPGGPETAEFYDVLSPANVSFKIFDYFMGLDGKPDQRFGIFDGDKIKVDDRSVIVSSPLRGISYAKVNYNISANGKGRAVWIGNYDYAKTTDPLDPEFNTSKLVTALVLWASGESYSLDPVPKALPDVFYEYKYLGVLNGSETFGIRLKAWRVFY